MANLLQWSYHGRSPCTVLVGEETGETSAKASISDVGNRSSSSGRQRPSQTPSQSSGGIYSFGPVALVRKRRSVDQPHDLPLSLVDVEVHEPTVETLTEHAPSDSSEGLRSPVVSTDDTNSRAPPPGELSSPAAATTLSTKEASNTILASTPSQSASNITNNSATTLTSTNISTNTPSTTVAKVVDSPEGSGQTYDFYKQNIIRRMQDMIMAGHMSDSFVLNDLEAKQKTVEPKASYSNTSEPLSGVLSFINQPPVTNKKEKKTLLPEVQFENNTYDMQSDFPAPPSVHARRNTQQMRKVETVLHPMTVKQIKNNQKEEKQQNYFIGSVVKYENYPRTQIVESDVDSGADEIEIYKLESFEDEVQEALDEDEIRKQKAKDSKHKTQSTNDKTWLENNINDSQTIKTTQGNFINIESTSTPPRLETSTYAPNPNIISLTLPNDTLHGSANRLFVNVTIATGDAASQTNVSAVNPVYVLSLSFPTGNSSEDIKIHPVVPQLVHKTEVSPKTDIPETTTLIPGFINRGGECQCSCPCLSNPKLDETLSDVDMFPGPSSKSEEFVPTTLNLNISDENSTADIFVEATEEYNETDTSEYLVGYETDSLENSTDPTSTGNLTENSTPYNDIEDISVIDVNTNATSVGTEEEDSTEMTMISTSEDTILDEDTDESEDPEMITSTKLPLECPKVTVQPPTVLILEGKVQLVIYKLILRVKTNLVKQLLLLSKITYIA